MIKIIYIYIYCFLFLFMILLQANGLMVSKRLERRRMLEGIASGFMPCAIIRIKTHMDNVCSFLGSRE